jgi:hypothetical protein
MREFAPMSEPTTLADYRIVSEFGEGGMGATYGH